MLVCNRSLSHSRPPRTLTFRNPGLVFRGPQHSRLIISSFSSNTRVSAQFVGDIACFVCLFESRIYWHSCNIGSLSLALKGRLVNGHVAGKVWALLIITRCAKCGDALCSKSWLKSHVVSEHWANCGARPQSERSVEPLWPQYSCHCTHYATTKVVRIQHSCAQRNCEHKVSRHWYCKM